MKLRLMYLGKRQFSGQRPSIGVRNLKYAVIHGPAIKRYCVYLGRFALLIKF